MEMNWSRWFRCESSFGLLLVPNQPGIFALAEEMAASGPQSRRALAILEINDADDLSRALSRMFVPASPWPERLSQSSCYVRYAVVPNREERKKAIAALKDWMNSQFDAAARIFERTPVPEPSDITVAERAVDRVMREREKELANLTFP